MNQVKPRILILFYSTYGHIFQMANAVAGGVREAGGEVILKQVAELLPQEITGGSPYGVTTIAGGMGERMVSGSELKMARDFGKRLTAFAQKLAL